MKWKLLSLIFFLACYQQINGQVITVKKTCECTYNGNTSSTIRYSSTPFYPNKTYKAYITVQNTGTCAWGEREVELRVKIVRCPSGSACQRDELIPKKWDVNEDYRPRGESETFIYEFEGPEYTGKFLLSCQVYYENKPFGEAITYTIEIKPGK